MNVPSIDQHSAETSPAKVPSSDDCAFKRGLLPTQQQISSPLAASPELWEPDPRGEPPDFRKHDAERHVSFPGTMNGMQVG